MSSCSHIDNCIDCGEEICEDCSKSCPGCGLRPFCRGCLKDYKKCVTCLEEEEDEDDA